MQRPLAASTELASVSCKFAEHVPKCTFMRPLAHQRRQQKAFRQPVFATKLGNTEVSLRRTRRCCVAQAQGSGGLDLPKSQVIAAVCPAMNVCLSSNSKTRLPPPCCTAIELLNYSLSSQRPELESLKLSQAVRNSVQDAVEGLGGRVTVGDVAARAGVKISQAEEALNALAADAGGTLEVQTLCCTLALHCKLTETSVLTMIDITPCLEWSIMLISLPCIACWTCNCCCIWLPALHCVVASHSSDTAKSIFHSDDFLQVSDAGDVLYVLPQNFKQIIAGKSWLLRAEPFLQKVRDAAAYLVRVTFGTALITSVVVVWVTIVAILSSSGKDDDRRYSLPSCVSVDQCCIACEDYDDCQVLLRHQTVVLNAFMYPRRFLIAFACVMAHA